jgi:phosphodiester glycosidase
MASGASLAVWHRDAWQSFWRADAAPARFPAGDPRVLEALRWKPLAPGLEWAELRLACPAPVWRARLIVARLDPREVQLTLAMDLTREDMRPAWSVDRAPEDALLAVNAGQFASAMPWGWVMIDGQERLPRGHGPLASEVGIDADGRVHWAHGDSLAAGGTAGAPAILTGFQSYPTLLAGNGVVPEALRTQGSGLSLTHRDARLAIGETRDGHLVIVMTRYDAVGEMGEGIPLGPTTPEMAAIMGALGATDAVMLDGGISAQMLLRDPTQRDPLCWRGLRRVPLALIARERAPAIGRAGKP